MEKVKFEVYTRKPEFLQKAKSFETMYLVPEHAPDNFVRSQWNFIGFSVAPKSATLKEVKKGQIYRDCPSTVDPHALWPNL